jgi:hypothetical protein
LGYGGKIISNQVQLGVNNRGVTKVERKIELADGDVVSMSASLETIFTNSPTSKMGEIRSSFSAFLGKKSWWFSSGVHCEVLRETGGGWERGKLRLIMVFEPLVTPTPKTDDSTENRENVSVFDDLQQINEVS